jgi:hypothetical protein
LLIQAPLLALALMLADPGSAAAPADTLADAGTPAWSGYASAYAYFVRNGDDFVTAVAWADRGILHQEARYNYEDFDTGSLWVGVNLDGDGGISWEVTLMVGAAFGSTDGIVPGYRGALSWRAFDFSSEGEYLFDLGDKTDDFFYSWSELGWSRAWFRGGIAAQRTRVYQTDAEVQRGVLAGGSWHRVDAAIYWFEPGSGDAAVMLLAGLAF